MDINLNKGLFKKNLHFHTSTSSASSGTGYTKIIVTEILTFSNTYLDEKV